MKMKKTVICLCLAAALLLGGCFTTNEQLREMRAGRAEWIREDHSFRYKEAVYRRFPQTSGEFWDTEDGKRQTIPVYVAGEGVPLLLLDVEGSRGEISADLTTARMYYSGEIYYREDMMEEWISEYLDGIPSYRLLGLTGEYPLTDGLRDMLRETLINDDVSMLGDRLDTGDRAPILLRLTGGGDVFLYRGKYYYTMEWMESSDPCRLFYAIPDKYGSVIEKALAR